MCIFGLKTSKAETDTRKKVDESNQITFQTLLRQSVRRKIAITFTINEFNPKLREYQVVVENSTDCHAAMRKKLKKN